MHRAHLVAFGVACALGLLAPLHSQAAARAADTAEIVYGRSRGGTPLRAIAVAKGAGRLDHDALARRPGILVVAGLDGRYTDDPDIARRIADAVAAAPADSPLAQTLAHATLWVIPAAHPDGLAHGERRSRQAPSDEDRDRREGEDPPDDLDGDGVIRWMRWPDPEGTHVLDREHPLGMREAKPGDEGVRYRLVVEGRDDDGDGRYNEDAPGGAMPCRNFAFGYREHAPGAGAYVFSEPEALALAEFVLATPGLAAVLVFGDEDDLLAPPRKNTADRREPITGFLDEDHALLVRLGERYREISGRSGKNHEDWSGSFAAWAYAHAGLPALTTTLLDRRIPKAEKEQAEKDRAQEEPPGELPPGVRAEVPAPVVEPELAPRHAWALHAFGADALRPWRLAAVPRGLPAEAELGGFDERLLYRVPEDARDQVVRTHVDFVQFLLASLPEVEIRGPVVRPLDAARKTARVTAHALNRGLLPVRTELGRRLGHLPAPRLELRAAGPAPQPRLLAPEALLIGAPWQQLEELGARGTTGRAEWVVSLPDRRFTLLLVLPSGEEREIEGSW